MSKAYERSLDRGKTNALCPNCDERLDSEPTGMGTLYYCLECGFSTEGHYSKQKKKMEYEGVETLDRIYN